MIDTIYTYTVLHDDAEIAFAESDSFESARESALDDVPRMYPRNELTFIAHCTTGVIQTVTGPCYL
jgi:hypothetical protein